MPRLARVLLSIVDFILGRYINGRAFESITFYTLSLAIFVSLFLLYTEVYIIVTILPSLYRYLMRLYRQLCPTSPGSPGPPWATKVSVRLTPLMSPLG